jgi:hypothetical protein
MAFNPKVSIIIPVYNGSDYLKEAIESAITQTYKNIEVLVINDGSTDNGETEKIAMTYGDKIKYYKKTNGGVASALNFGIEKMQGEYFSWLSHDDIYYPEKIETQINFLDTRKIKEIFLFSDFEFIDKDSNHLSFYQVKEIYSRNSGLAILFNQINGCTTLIHKNILQKISNFPESFKTTQDYHAWVEIFKNRFLMVHTPKVLIKSRLHENQGTKKMIGICLEEIFFLEKTIIENIPKFYPFHLCLILGYYFKRNIDLYQFLLDHLTNNANIIFKVYIVFLSRLILLKSPRTK